MTTWYPIPGYSQYEMTDAGDVRTLDGQLQDLHTDAGAYHYHLQADAGGRPTLMYKHQMLQDLRERLDLIKEG